MAAAAAIGGSCNGNKFVCNKAAATVVAKIAIDADTHANRKNRNSRFDGGRGDGKQKYKENYGETKEMVVVMVARQAKVAGDCSGS